MGQGLQVDGEVLRIHQESPRGLGGAPTLGGVSSLFMVVSLWGLQEEDPKRGLGEEIYQPRRMRS